MSLKRVVLWSWLGVIAAFGYAGWVFYSRYSDQRRMAQEAEEKRAAQDRAILDKVGGDQLKILMFYANPPAVGAGEKLLLCYGVSNATEVRIEPGLPGLTPSLSRCVETNVRKNTSFELSASDKAGNSVKQTVDVKIK